MRASNALPRVFVSFILSAVCIAGSSGCDSKPGEAKIGGAVIDPEVEAANAAATKDNADLLKKPDASAKKPK